MTLLDAARSAARSRTATPAGRRRVIPSDVAVVCVLVALAAGRTVLLASAGAPPGVDGGNWLAFGRALFGDARPGGLVYPPLVPLLAVVLEAAAGPVAGLALLGGGASVAPAAGLYAVLRGRAAPIPAAALAVLVAGASSVGEAAAWGGVPQLVGLGLALPALDRARAALGSLRAGDIPPEARRAGTFTAIVLIAAVAATSHLVTAVVATGVLAVAAWAVWCGASPVAVAWRVPVLFVGAVPMAGVVAAIAAESAVAPDAGASQVGGLLAGAEFLYRDFAPFWRSALVVGALAPLLLWHRRGDPVWVVSAAGVASTVAWLVATREPRFWYLLQPPAVAGLALWTSELRARRAHLLRASGRAAVAGLVVASVVQVASGLAFFRAQRDFYAVLTPKLWSATATLERASGRDSLIAVAPVRDVPFGWWIEGLAGRRTLAASPLRWLTFADERARADVANRLFRRGFPSSRALREAAGVRVTHLFVAKAWPGYSAARVEALRGSGHIVVVHEDDESLVAALTSARR